MQLITVGTVAFDRIETPFGVAEKTVGGAATYISLAASIFLEKMGLVSVVGDDFPESVMQQLRDRGVDLLGWRCSKARRASSGPAGTTTT
jgi:sugar/nucleoside kinase (ribokinase family)